MAYMPSWEKSHSLALPKTTQRGTAYKTKRGFALGVFAANKKFIIEETAFAGTPAGAKATFVKELEDRLINAEMQKGTPLTRADMNKVVQKLSRSDVITPPQLRGRKNFLRGLRSQAPDQYGELMQKIRKQGRYTALDLDRLIADPDSSRGAPAYYYLNDDGSFVRIELSQSPQNWTVTDVSSANTPTVASALASSSRAIMTSRGMSIFGRYSY